MAHENADQAAFWNGDIGRRWSACEAEHETLTREVGERLLAAAGPGLRVIEVGCGTGSLSLALARRVGPEGTVLGIDISGPMLDRARERGRAEGLANLGFRQDDAQDADLPPADLILSQFGVMFFADPVAAFANLRAALRPGGRVLCATWGSPDRNPWFGIPRAAAAARLGASALAPGAGPGPFGLCDGARAETILRAAGFSDAAATPVSLMLHVAGGSAGAADWLTTTGPASALLREKGGSDTDRVAIRAEIAAAMRDYDTPAGLRVPAVVLFLSGRA